MSYVTAFSTLEVIQRRFDEFGFPLITDRRIVPNDETTMFVCSGMQMVRDRFGEENGEKYGSLQSCVRTNDFDLVADGEHLTYFEMIGNFQFGGNEYEESVELWHRITLDLGINISHVTVHPECYDHQEMWKKRGYNIVLTDDCVWSDGEIGGKCCEMFVGELEVGNLVNTLGNSVDVGFGFERLVQIIEEKDRVDESSLFRIDLPPVVRDHIRCLDMFWEHNITPMGGKGRSYICKILLRRLLHMEIEDRFSFSEWLDREREICDKKFVDCKRALRKHKHKNKSIKWWCETFGITEEDLVHLRQEKFGM